MGQCKPRMFCYRCRSFWAWHLKGQFACLSKTVVHSLDLPIAQQFLSFWWTLIVCSSNLSNILTQSVKCLLREMLISLALVASACQPLFLNYAIEKSSNLWPHFRTQFWTQFRVQLWHLLLFFPYRVPNWAPKLVPKIGPQNESKLAPKTWPQIWLFSIVPFKNQGCQAHQSKKSQHSTQQVFFTDSLKRLEGLLAHVPSPDVKKNSNEKGQWTYHTFAQECKWGNVSPECSATVWQNCAPAQAPAPPSYYSTFAEECKWGNVSPECSATGAEAFGLDIWKANLHAWAKLWCIHLTFPLLSSFYHFDGH